MSLYIRGGRLVDPSQGIDRKAELWVRDGRIEAILSSGSTPPQTPKTEIDVQGAFVSPGFVDLHAHLREPGQEEKEDIESGSRAAVAGGFTSVLCMPNTSPTNDSVEVTQKILKRAREVGLCHIYPVGAVTRGLQGKALSPLVELRQAGCVAFSDDGRPVFDSNLLRQAMTIAKTLNVPVIEHCEELSLSSNPTIHNGAVAKRLGLEGIPVSAETTDVARTLMLACEVGARVHLAHVSCADSLALLRVFKRVSSGITAEATPHHLVLTHEAVERCGTDAKMYPPLRTEEDCRALRQALKDGTVDAVATDHAPHTAKEKARTFPEAPNGIVGLESAFPVLADLVYRGELEVSELVSKMSTVPAKIVGIPGGSLSVGEPADITVFEIGPERKFHRSDMRSKSKNTPFDEFPVRGRVTFTFVGGREVFRA